LSKNVRKPQAAGGFVFDSHCTLAEYAAYEKPHRTEWTVAGVIM